MSHPSPTPPQGDPLPPMPGPVVPDWRATGNRPDLPTPAPQPLFSPQVTVTQQGGYGVAMMPTSPRKSGGVTFALALLLGYFGAHRFYLGQIGLGLLYLFTAGLFGVGWIVDIFMSASMTRHENAKRGYGFVS